MSAFEESLRQLGCIRGSNISFETRSPGGRTAVADLLRLNVEVIVTGPNAFIDAAKEATTTVPIVMVYGNDPIGRGYIASLSHPGGNITGLTWEASAEIFGKHVELLSELSPRLSRIGVISDPSAPQVAYFGEANVAAKRRGITLQYAIVAGRAGAVMIFGGPRLWGLRLPLAHLAAKNALPTILHVSRGP